MLQGQASGHISERRDYTREDLSRIQVKVVHTQQERTRLQMILSPSSASLLQEPLGVKQDTFYTRSPTSPTKKEEPLVRGLNFIFPFGLPIHERKRHRNQKRYNQHTYCPAQRILA